MGLLSFIRQPNKASPNSASSASSKWDAITSTPHVEVASTELESALLRPIGSEEEVTVPEQTLVEPTLAELIINSMESEPNLWYYEYERAKHKNGTNLYISDGYVFNQSDTGVKFTGDEQRSITEAYKKASAEKTRLNNIAATKRAKARFGH